jgi:predicted lipoprotein
MRYGFAALVVVALASSLGACKLVPNKTEADAHAGAASGAGDAGSKLETMAQTMWQPEILPYFQKATDLTVLVPAMRSGLDSAGKQYGYRAGGEGTPWSFAVHFKGTIVSADTETRAATIAIDSDSDGKADATLQLGPVIRGTALRDSLPFVNFSNFADQIEFASFSRALNDRAYKNVLAALPRDGLRGREVSGRGALTMRTGSDEILITPVALELGGAP